MENGGFGGIRVGCQSFYGDSLNLFQLVNKYAFL